MKRTVKTKLALNRETLRALDLSGIRGGKDDVTDLISECIPTFCLGSRCFPPPDSTPGGGCSPSLEVPCEEPVSAYC